MNADLAEIDEFLIPAIFVGAGMITLSICSLIRDRRETDAEDDIAAGHTMIRILEIIALIVVLGGLVSMGVLSDIYTCDKELARYNNAVKNGYKVYYNGAAASGDALAINVKTIGDFDIVFDDKNKAIKVKDKRYHNGGSNSFFYINGLCY